MIRNAVKEILKSKGMTQSDLAERLGTTQETVSRQIGGNPTLKTITEIANALDVPIQQLFTGESDIIHLIVKGKLHSFHTFNELKEFVYSEEKNKQ